MPKNQWKKQRRFPEEGEGKPFLRTNGAAPPWFCLGSQFESAYLDNGPNC